MTINDSAYIKLLDNSTEKDINVKPTSSGIGVSSSNNVFMVVLVKILLRLN